MSATQVFSCKPSDIRGRQQLLPIPACSIPLAGTLQKMEREVVAAIVVEYCRNNEDTWQPVPADALGQALERYAGSNAVLMTMYQGIINEMWAMSTEEQGFFVIDQSGHPQTLAATPKLVELIK